MASPRNNVVSAVKAFFKARRNARYFVTRSAVDWAAFDFVKHPYAVSILFDDSSFLREFNTGTLSLEMMTALPGNPTEFDETVLDEFFEDAVALTEALTSAKDKSGDTLVTRIHRGLENAVETHDASKGVQGLVVTIPIDY